MTLEELLKASDITPALPSANVELHALQYDSRKVQAGDLFIAVRGYQTDGHRYLGQAAKKGAIAAVVETKDPNLDLLQVVVSDSRRAMADLAAAFYWDVLDEMHLIGITGTNGKTSTAFLLHKILTAAGRSAGLLGTIAYLTGEKQTAAWNTTPEALDICAMLSEMHMAGQRWAVLEVSSHALALNRVDGLRFDAAVFTNLTRDHMDFHETDQNYFEAKRHLFELMKPSAPAIINLDDPWGVKLKTSTEQSVVGYGLEGSPDLSVVDWKGDIHGLHITVAYQGKQYELESGLIGAFNVYNIIAAVSTALALGIDFDTIASAVAAFETVPGRLQALTVKPGVRAVIDYAHTPDALEKALAALRPLTNGRLIALFGAGGNRDKGKRPLMGKVAAAGSDLAIVTTDNPRFEDPAAIIKDVVAGMPYDCSKEVIVDRREAIKQAVQMAKSGDVILIAGKGHEPYQDIAGVKHPFDEIAIVREAANA